MKTLCKILLSLLIAINISCEKSESITIPDDYIYTVKEGILSFNTPDDFQDFLGAANENESILEEINYLFLKENNCHNNCLSFNNCLSVSILRESIQDGL